MWCSFLEIVKIVIEYQNIVFDVFFSTKVSSFVVDQFVLRKSDLLLHAFVVLYVNKFYKTTQF